MEILFNYYFWVVCKWCSKKAPRLPPEKPPFTDNPTIPHNRSTKNQSFSLKIYETFNWTIAETVNFCN
jgi:hypothetical protein